MPVPPKKKVNDKAILIPKRQEKPPPKKKEGERQGHTQLKKTSKKGMLNKKPRFSSKAALPGDEWETQPEGFALISGRHENCGWTKKTRPFHVASAGVGKPHAGITHRCRNLSIHSACEIASY